MCESSGGKREIVCVGEDRVADKKFAERNAANQPPLFES